MWNHYALDVAIRLIVFSTYKYEYIATTFTKRHYTFINCAASEMHIKYLCCIKIHTVTSTFYLLMIPTVQYIHVLLFVYSTLMLLFVYDGDISLSASY